jgi:NAD+ synthase (glutamine-hydrolysing)
MIIFVPTNLHPMQTFSRIAAAVPRVWLADVDKNQSEILSLMHEAAGRGVQLLVFPPDALTGATCGSLFRQELLRVRCEAAAEEIRQEAARLGIRVFLDGRDGPVEGIAIRREARAEEVTGYRFLRANLAAESKGMVLLYCSSGYGESTQDGVYAGSALIFRDGRLLAENPRFRRSSTLLVADLCAEGTPVAPYVPQTGSRSPFVADDPDERALRCEEVFAIQTTALCARLEHIRCRTALVGISGGLDSTLALLVCCAAFDALGIPRENIHAVTMPGFGTSGRTHGNAWQLMEKLGTTPREIPIAEAVSGHFKDIGQDPSLRDVTFENAQARERTQILMDLSNRLGGIVVGTGDLSEIALGWCTYNGDHMSMYNVNGGVPKTLMQTIVSWAAQGPFSAVGDVLRDIVATPISPELTPTDAAGNIHQKTEDIIGPYELHDFFLYHLVRHGRRPAAILARAKDAFAGIYGEEEIKKWLKTFLKRFFSQQFKRSCSADGPKVGSVSLSPRGAWTMPSDASAALWLSDLD